MRKNFLSLIIPNYNGKQLLEKNLPHMITALKKVKNYESEVIIVDDCSDDESIQFLKKKFPDITLVYHEKNLGFSASVNDGIKQAQGDIVILLNSDTTPTINAISHLLSHFSDPLCFAVACMQEGKIGGQIQVSGRGIGVFKRGFLVHRAGRTDGTNTLWVSGGAGAFRMSLWKELGGLDEVFDPFYWEDIDLSYRGLKAGYKLNFEKKSLVTHTQETGAIRARYNQFTINVIAYRNQFFFFWKNVTSWSLIISHLFWLPCHFIFAAIRRDKAFFIGFIAALVKLPKILQSRKRVSKLWRMNDVNVVLPFTQEIGSKL